MQGETLQLSVTDSHLDADQRMWPVGLTRTGPKMSLDSLPQLKNVRLSFDNEILKQASVNYVLNAAESFLLSKFTILQQFCIMSF